MLWKALGPVLGEVHFRNKSITIINKYYGSGTRSLIAARNRLWVTLSALQVDQSSIISNSPCGDSSESGVPHNLAHPGSPWPSSRPAPVMVWCVSRPGVHGTLQSHMCRCAIMQTTDDDATKLRDKVEQLYHALLRNEVACLSWQVAQLVASSTTVICWIETISILCQFLALLLSWDPLACPWIISLTLSNSSTCWDCVLWNIRRVLTPGYIPANHGVLLGKPTIW